jgi:hypothetical protein
MDLTQVKNSCRVTQCDFALFIEIPHLTLKTDAHQLSHRRGFFDLFFFLYESDSVNEILRDPNRFCIHSQLYFP